jgi:histidinol-phosphate/aromatic aminotransferase/cobyric acid decarboxylase-like protein
MNFKKVKINSDQAFNKLANKGLILRKMDQYKISNSLRLTIGNEKENKNFIKIIDRILN